MYDVEAEAERDTVCVPVIDSAAVTVSVGVLDAVGEPEEEAAAVKVAVVEKVIELVTDKVTVGVAEKELVMEAVDDSVADCVTVGDNVRVVDSLAEDEVVGDVDALAV
jgi:hypothetical protein